MQISPLQVRTIADIAKCWCGYEEALYLVTGFNAKGGGVLATCRDIFTAYRFRKILLAEYPIARVVENTEEEIKKNSNAMGKFLNPA